MHFALHQCHGRVRHFKRSISVATIIWEAAPIENIRPEIKKNSNQNSGPSFGKNSGENYGQNSRLCR